MDYDTGIFSYFDTNYIYIVVIIVLIVIIIIQLYVLLNGNTLNNMNIKQSNCPDYWLDMSNGNGSNCKNYKNLGKCSEKNIDFTTSSWSGNNSLCKKYEWARKCDLSWDGITNNPDITKCSQ